MKMEISDRIEKNVKEIIGMIEMIPSKVKEVEVIEITEAAIEEDKIATIREEVTMIHIRATEANTEEEEIEAKEEEIEEDIESLKCYSQ